MYMSLRVRVCPCDPLVVELQCEQRDAIILLCLRGVIRAELCCFFISSLVRLVWSC